MMLFIYNCKTRYKLVLDSTNCTITLPLSIAVDKILIGNSATGCIYGEDISSFNM